MSDRKRLTVCLNARNGVSELLDTFSEHSNEVEFLIIDDACDAQPLRTDARVIRNRAKIGPSMCALRAMEHATGDWIWAPHSADRFHPDALQRVLHVAQGDAAFVHMGASAPQRVNGPEPFLSALGSLETLCEPSLTVFRREAAQDNLHAAYRFAYCGSAHLAMAMCLLKPGVPVELSDANIVDQFGGCGLSKKTAPYRGLSMLLELPFELDARQLLRTHLQAMTKRGFTPEAFEEALASELRDPRDKRYIKRMRAAAVERFFHRSLPEREVSPLGKGQRPRVASDSRDGRLTVGIPTYNRPNHILKVVDQLMPQLARHDAELLVLDNHSEQPVQDLLQPLLKAHPEARCRIVRNASNIGGNPNILRLFEHCETEYLWTLGDDDRLVDDAVGLVCRHLGEHPDASFFNFASRNPTHPPRTADRVCNGLNELLEKADGVGPLMFLSANVYRVDRMLPHLETALSLLYSCAPQFAIVLAAAREGDTALIAHEMLIDSVSDGTPAALQSNSVYPAAGLAMLLEIECDDRAQEMLAEQLYTTTHGWLTVKSVAYNLAMGAAATGNVDYALTQFDAARRLLGLRPDPRRALELAIAGWMIARPRLTAALVERLIPSSRQSRTEMTQLSAEVSKRA